MTAGMGGRLHRQCKLTIARQFMRELRGRDQAGPRATKSHAPQIGETGREIFRNYFLSLAVTRSSVIEAEALLSASNMAVRVTEGGLGR